METKNVTLRLPIEQTDWLNENYKNLNQGVISAIDALKTIRVYSLSELKGKFDPGEWTFFADSLNGIITDRMFRCNSGALVAHSEDSEQFNGTATKHNVNLPELLEKIKALPGAQVDALYFRVEQFWDNPKANLQKWAEY